MDNLKPILESKKVFISTKIKKVNAWTKEEDEILLEQAEKYGYRHWKKIASSLKNRSSIQCSARYKRIRPGLVKGNWSKDEDGMVLELVAKFGKNWSLISKYIPSRTGKQIRDRFLNTLDSNINRDKFSAEEDKKIIELYLQYGTKWSNIAKFFEKRTGDMIKNRFYSTLRKKVHGYFRFKKNSNRKIKRLRKIRRNSKIHQKNLFKINNLQIIKNELILDQNQISLKNDLLNCNQNSLEKNNILMSIGEEDISKLKTDSSIYPKNVSSVNQDNSSFLHFPKSHSSSEIPLAFPQFPPYNYQESRPSTMFQQQQPASIQTYNSYQRQVNVNDYVIKMKQIESSMNQSLLNYLNFSNQYQMMNTLYNYYLNNSDKGI